MHFLVVGLGNFGASATQALQELGHQVSALDLDPEKVERMAPLLERALVGDGTEPEVLREAGAEQVDAGIVSMGDDVVGSVLSAVGLRDCGVRNIYVKVVSDIHGRILERVGVTEIVFPERDSARRLSRRIASRAIVDYVQLGEGFSAQELAVPRSWVGRSLRDLELPRRYSISVIAVRDYLSGKTTPIPDPDAPLKDSDTILIAGADGDLQRIARIQ